MGVQEQYVWQEISSVRPRGGSTKPVKIQGVSERNRDGKKHYTVRCDDGHNYILDGDALVRVEGGAQVLSDFNSERM